MFSWQTKFQKIQHGEADQIEPKCLVAFWKRIDEKESIIIVILTQKFCCTKNELNLNENRSIDNEKKMKFVDPVLH